MPHGVIPYCGIETGGAYYDPKGAAAPHGVMPYCGIEAWLRFAEPFHPLIAAWEDTLLRY